MSKFAQLRLSKELKKLNTDDKIEGIIIENPVDLFFWKAQIKGPISTPFENGIFDITLTFNTDYPVKPPSVKFLTPMFHPNIYSDGKICISILNEGVDQYNYEDLSERWKPTLNVNSILISILSILSNLNFESPANIEASLLWQNDFDKYKNIIYNYVSKSQN